MELEPAEMPLEEIFWQVVTIIRNSQPSQGIELTEGETKAVGLGLDLIQPLIDDHNLFDGELKTLELIEPDLFKRVEEVLDHAEFILCFRR